MSALVSASFWYWYYVQTKSRAEAVALENLVRQHYHCLFPQIRRVNPATGSQPRKSLIAPLWNLENLICLARAYDEQRQIIGYEGQWILAFAGMTSKNPVIRVSLYFHATSSSLSIPPTNLDAHPILHWRGLPDAFCGPARERGRSNHCPPAPRCRRRRCDRCLTPSHPHR